MKVCYIWVDKFRNLKNFGFNLSSEYKFNYDVDKNQISRRKEAGVPKNFFGENISDVIALVGRNGSGKSNALELICLALKGGRTSFKSDFLVITEEEGSYFCYQSFSGLFKERPRSKFKLSHVDSFRDLTGVKVVYFSNVYDGRRYMFDRSVKDISLNTEVRRGRMPGSFRENKFYQQLSFINSDAFCKLNIAAPTEVHLKIRRNNRVRKDFGFGQYGDDFYSVMKDFETIFHERINDQRPISRLINVIKYQFFFEYFFLLLKGEVSESSSHSMISSVERTFNSFEGFKTDQLMDELLQILVDLWRVNPKENNVVRRRDKKFYTKVDVLLSIKDRVKGLKGFSHDAEGRRANIVDNFFFECDDEESYKFVSLLSQNFGDERFFELDWVGISSGHKAYLNLFSSISDALKRVRDSQILLCIDEGDLYLHPQWQVDFFNSLLEALSIITSKNVQLILTSHSPFLLSDLPNQNITVIDRGGDLPSYDGVDLEINTFGANLFDLYSEAFFLGASRRGKFSDRKIDEVVGVLSSEESNTAKNREAKKIAGLVGDELIKYAFSRLIVDD